VLEIDTTQDVSTKMRVTYLKKRWLHHTTSGGYDRLSEIEAFRTIGRPNARGLIHRFARGIWRRVPRSEQYLLDYRYEDWLAEWRLLLGARFASPDIVHVLYGDEQLNVLLRMRQWLPCPLVATFHLPTPRVKIRFEQKHHLCNRIDMAIVVARSQLADFKAWLGPERVAFVPHGIDTQRFCPSGAREISDSVRLVAVGEHMRDLDALNTVAHECRNLKLPVRFDVVVPEKCYQHFRGCSNVDLYTAISEHQLIKLYSRADALVLPVIDATANNAVLESMACGTPVISTRIGGIPDYVNDAAGWLFPKGEVCGIVDLIKSFCRDKKIVESRRLGARTKALEFDWYAVRSQMQSLYESICDRSPKNLKLEASLIGNPAKVVRSRGGDLDNRFTGKAE
jgi:glycosyltransferase involved in cell wall biosynthesis